MSQRNGYNKNITIVKRVCDGEITFDYYPNRRVAQAWCDCFNKQKANGYAVIVESKDKPNSSSTDDTVIS